MGKNGALPVHLEAVTGGFADRCERISRIRKVGESDGIFSVGPGDVRVRAKETVSSFIHVPVKGSISVAMLCSDWLTYEGHFSRGQIRPHDRFGCEWCDAGIGRKWRYVFSAVDLSDGSAGILELGAVPAEKFLDEEERSGFLRGLQFELWHDGHRVNGGIRVRPLGVVTTPDELPEPIDVRAALRNLWNK